MNVGGDDGSIGRSGRLFVCDVRHRSSRPLIHAEVGSLYYASLAADDIWRPQHRMGGSGGLTETCQLRKATLSNRRIPPLRLRRSQMMQGLSSRELSRGRSISSITRRE